MSLAECIYEPVVEIRDADGMESAVPESQKASPDQFTGTHDSGQQTSDTGGANSINLKTSANVDVKVYVKATDLRNMERENDVLDASREKVSEVALLKVPCFDSDNDGIFNQAFYTGANLNVPDKRDGDSALYHAVDESRFQNSRDIKSGHSGITTQNIDHKSGFADSIEEVEDKGIDYAKKKKSICVDDKEVFSEVDLNKERNSQSMKSSENGREIKPNNSFNNSPESNDSNDELSRNKPAEEIIIGSKSKEKEKLNNTEMNVPEEDEDTICGLGSFKPKWLQKWATPRCYLILYTIIGVCQGSYYSYRIGIMSTLEKRFAFKSKVSGVIMIVDEITPLILGVFVGYFGGKAHRPRMVTFGMFLTTLCALFSAMPFFIYGPARHLVYSNSTGHELCDLEQKGKQCDQDDRPPTLVAVVLLIFGSFLKGFGNLAYYAVGLSYMDDNAKKKNTPIYLGFSIALRFLGPTCGFLMSSAFLKINENPFEDPGFDTEDPRWIGAWWLGYVVQGVVLLIISLPLMLFPRRLPRQGNIKPDLQSSSEHEGIIQKFKGLLAGLKRLSTNKLYVFLGIETIFSIAGQLGYYMLLPKYMESRFRLSTSDASLYSGPPGLIALQVSTVLGSLIIWKFRLRARAIMAGKIITQTIGVILFLLMMIPSCPDISLVVSSSVSTIAKGVELENECNRNCSCTAKVFTPLCGPDGVSTYFSSCHAGCSEALPKDVNDREVFGNCSCVNGGNGTFINVEKMEKGFCANEDCWTQAKFYITLLPLMTGFTSLFGIGQTMILLRSVDPQDKSFALGSFETVICLLGFIPYPLVYGALADSVCLVWEFSCGYTGNCWIYDIQKFNYLIHGVCACFCVAAILCNIRILSLCRKIRDLYKDDEDDGEKEKQKESGEKLCDSTIKNKYQENSERTSC